ncbi:MAG TPA: pirin-like C-terminal cupin domain-containing protein, partial [Kofleriaceae bacterium]|nr:pirin-like C-terminal cupin domain-containing protein [Kofleriaceae bacterium]
APAPGVNGRVLIGSAFGATSPVVHPSQPTLIALELDVGARFDVPELADRGVYVVGGRVAIGDTELARDQLAVVRGDACVVAREASRVMILGGAPLGHRFIDWNFVSSSQEAIDRARAGWKAQTFPKIPGDDQEFIPLPEFPRH